jgi:hypothetical protein
MTSFHVDGDYEGSVVEILEDNGFDVEVGGSPMVDFRVTYPDTE